MTGGLVLSLFPGAGMLDAAFEMEGFTVVRGPDVLWGGDIRRFHPPAGRFDGIIGGDPCQSHSALANLVRAKGLTPSFPDMTPEYQRVVEEARPAWFLRENTPRAPEIKPAGYDVRTFVLDNWASLGEEQQRTRRFWFGVREGECPELRCWIEFALELPASATAVGGNDGTADAIGGYRKARAKGQEYQAPRRDLAEMLRLQGFPEDWIGHQPWTKQAMRKMVGNGVPLPLGRAVARAVRKALGDG